MSQKTSTRRPEQNTSQLDGLFLQPWFLPKRIQLAIRSLIPQSYHMKMRHMFDDYGCMICGRDDDYGSNGLCELCTHIIRGRLLRSVRRRLRQATPKFHVLLLRREKLAKSLLRKFLPVRSSVGVRRLDIDQPINPVDEALSALPR